MLHLRMVRTKARDSYSAKLCPLTEFRSCSLAFRRQNSLRDKKLHDGKSVNGMVRPRSRPASNRSCVILPPPSRVGPRAVVLSLLKYPTKIAIQSQPANDCKAAARPRTPVGNRLRDGGLL